MAITGRRLDQLRLGETAARRRMTETGGLGRFVLLAAGFAALVAWGLLHLPEQQPGRDAWEPNDTQEQPLYDGHGKWGGYTSR